MNDEPITCYCIETTDLPLVEIRDGIRVPQYRRKDTGEIIVGTQPGAIFFYDEIMGSDHPPRNVGPDGRALIVVLPNNDWWWIDAPATRPPGNKWTRTGTPPKVTATPSIDMGGPDPWHGYLTDGVLRKV
ncbi:MAG: hypothetical protein KGL39_37445 [Patescibacteria group bacterium]|nr:hypothetical protein [Patescibacteria group bacterium]